MSIVLDGTTGLAGAATGALNGTLGATTPSSISATTINASGVITGNGSGLTNLPAGAAPAALSTASGSAPSYSARAWVNFNGTGTVAIKASGNVTSITDNATGDYTVNFTTAFSDANYGITSSASPAGGEVLGVGLDYTNSTKTTTALRITVKSPNIGRSDSIDISIAIFR
jgi:hypothetical protein